jgi:serine protease AprX
LSPLPQPFDPNLLRSNPASNLTSPACCEDHPGWKQEDGIGPECVHGAVEKAREARSLTSLQAELLTPFPVYSRDEKQLLPTPLRVHANPNFTGRGVTVAFLDSGFYPHPDLIRPRNRILSGGCHWLRPCRKTKLQKPSVTSWHGLMTSAICAGNGFMSDHLYRGLAENARLVLVKQATCTGGIHDRYAVL